MRQRAEAFRVQDPGCDFEVEDGRLCGEPLVGMGIPVPDGSGSHRRCGRHYVLPVPPKPPKHECNVHFPNMLRVSLVEENEARTLALREDRSGRFLVDARDGSTVVEFATRTQRGDSLPTLLLLVPTKGESD